MCLRLWHVHHSCCFQPNRAVSKPQDNPALEAIWEHMPEREGVMADMKAGDKLDIAALLPPNATR
jgi:hypothetical protein